MPITSREAFFFGIGVLTPLLAIVSYDGLRTTPEWQIEGIALSYFVRDAASHNTGAFVSRDTCTSEPVDLSEAKNGITWIFRCGSETLNGSKILVYYNLTKSGAVIYSEGWN